MPTEAPSKLIAALADRYTIERELGSGGMATVYLAHDLKHDRKVALKVLRPELAAVIGAERFLAEIKTTAALQHPHILPLFDSGHADGFLFYVMPLIEGESLRDRLTREHQLPVDDAVRLAKEIASALDYAHRHGVIHRDIKPENILLHDGQAQVADFGIALAVSHAGGNRMTETGLSLGTPGYMSPEQATGERTLDARSDVYSLGCLLYEMLAGEPPHTGPTVQAVIAAVVTKDPIPLGERRKTVPLGVQIAVQKALAKLPADRFATAEAFAKALSEPVTGATAAAFTAGVGIARPAASRRLVVSLAAATTLLAVVAAWGWLRRAPEPGVNRYGLYLRAAEALQPVNNAAGGGRIAISPDGRKLVYSSRSEGGTHLMMKLREDAHASVLAGTDGATSPFFSPDGRQIGFIKDGKTVRLLPLEGGTALTITDSANTTAGDWGDDGFIYFESDSGIVRMRPGGGAMEQVYLLSQAKKEIGAEWPIVLPGGTGLIFRRRRAAQAQGDFEIVAMKLPHGEATAIARGVYARYAASGHLVVVTSDGKLIAYPFDAKKLVVTGPPAALYEGLESFAFGAEFALSRTGTLVYATATQVATREVVWVSRQGLAYPVDSTWKPEGILNSASLSPDGKSVAVGLQRGVKEDVWVKQLPAGPFSRITFGDTTYLRPSWSHDGRELIYIGDRGDNTGAVYEKRADGVGAQRALVSVKRSFGQALESADGHWLVLRTSGGDAGLGDILAVRTGDTTLVSLVATPAREFTPALSPDGKWLAYSSNESGTFEVYVRPFPNAASARWQLSTAGGSEPQWAHNGRELFYRSGNNDLIVAEIKTSPSFQIGAQRALFSLASFLPLGPVPTFAVAPNDSRFLFMRQPVAAQANELIVTENWLGELAARAKK